MNFLKVTDGNIADGKGQEIRLRGVNFGGWLMMEGYFMHAPSLAEQIFKKHFAKVLGAKALAELEREFRHAFITEKDMKTVADWGMNCVRLPFNYRLIEPKPYRYSKQGIAYLDEAVGWARKYKVRLILDLHAAPGAQNCDWHSDSLGKADLWESPANQKRVFALWEFLADRYKDEPAIAGYDLLNETVMDNIPLLNKFYRQLVKAIRRVDRKHILFVEGNRWAQDLDVLEP